MATPDPKQTENALQKVESLINCPICLETYTDPKLLPCLHIYCKDCLVKTIRQEHGERVLVCSVCRNITKLPNSWIAEFKVPFFVSTFIDGYKSVKQALETLTVKCDECGDSAAVGFCNDCEKYLCEGLCTQVHKQWKKYSGHVVVSVAERQANLANSRFKSKKEFESCQIHRGEMAKMFCEVCEVVVCRDCIFSKHRDHSERCYLVVDVAAEHKGVIQASMQSLNQQLQTVGVARSAVDAKLMSISDQNEQMKQNICTSFSEIIASIESRKSDLLSQVDMVVCGRVKKLEEQKEVLEVAYTQLRSCVNFANETLDIGSDADILGMKKTIVHRANEISTLISRFDFQSTEDVSINLCFSGDNSSLVRDCESFGLIRSHSVCPSKCRSSSEFVRTAVVGEITNVTVSAVNIDGVDCVDPIDDISCELVCASQYGKTISKGALLRSQGNKYELFYQPVNCGRNYVHIKINGEHIFGSPFPLFVFRPTPIRIIRDLQHPWGIALTSAEEVVVVESGDVCSVSVIGIDGKKTLTFGGKGSVPGKLSYPRGVALDGSHSIFVADYGNHRIQKFDSSGEFIQCAGSEGTLPLQFRFPFDLAIDSVTGRIYIADQKNHRIQILNNDLTFWKAFGSEGYAPGQFSYPCGVSIALDGCVYITDSGNDRVQVFSADGLYKKHFGDSEKGITDGQLNNPVGICINSYTNNVLVSDTNNHRICCFSMNGEFIGAFGQKGASPGQFDFPGGIATNKNGSVCYVADQFNGCIQVF